MIYLIELSISFFYGVVCFLNISIVVLVSVIFQFYNFYSVLLQICHVIFSCSQSRYFQACFSISFNLASIVILSCVWIWSFGDNLLMFVFLVLIHRVCFLMCLIYAILIVNKKLLIWMIWYIEWLSLPPKRICICFLGVWGDRWSRIILSKFKNWDSLSVQCCKPI